MAKFPMKVVVRDNADSVVEQVVLTAGGRARRAIQSMIDLALQGGGGSGSGGLTAADKSLLLAVRSRSDTDEQAPSATNWSPRPTGFGAVVAVGAAPGPADAGPFDIRVGRAPAGSTETTTTFTLVDGSAWPVPWSVERVPAGGGVTVSGQRGVMNTGSAGGGAAADEVAVRYGGAHTDVDVLATFRLVTDSARPALVLRSTQANLSASDGVIVEFHSGALTVRDVVAGSASAVGQAAKTFTTGADYRLRVVASGSVVWARTWPVTGSEPTGWDVSAAVTKTAAGYVGLVVGGAAGAGAAQQASFDDITIQAAVGGYGLRYGDTWGA